MGGDNRSSAVADTLPRLIKMSELHERLGVSKRERESVEERRSRKTTNYKSCKQNSVQSVWLALAKLFEHCYL